MPDNSKKPIPEQVVFVAEANDSIGREITEGFAQDGYKVIATTASLNDYSTLSKLAKRYTNISIIELDLTGKVDKIKRVIQSVGTIDILVFNASLTRLKNVRDLSVLKTVFYNRVNGLAIVTDTVLSIMKAQNYGQMILLNPRIKQPSTRSIGPCFYLGCRAMIEEYVVQLKHHLQESACTIEITYVHSENQLLLNACKSSIENYAPRSEPAEPFKTTKIPIGLTFHGKTQPIESPSPNHAAAQEPQAKL